MVDFQWTVGHSTNLLHESFSVFTVRCELNLWTFYRKCACFEVLCHWFVIELCTAYTRQKVRWWVLLELVNANITVHYPSNHFRRTWSMRRLQTLYWRVTYLRMSFFLKQMNIRLQVFLNKSLGKHLKLKTKWHGDWEYYIMLNVVICICNNHHI